MELAVGISSSLSHIYQKPSEIAPLSGPHAMVVQKRCPAHMCLPHDKVRSACTQKSQANQKLQSKSSPSSNTLFLPNKHLL